MGGVSNDMEMSAPSSNGFVNEIVSLLSHCVVVDNQQRGEAERRLHEMVPVAGFPSTLLKLSAATELDVTLRLASVIFLKNLIRSHWHFIQPEEKHLIRENILHCLKETDPALNEHYNLCIGYISEHDFPEVWPGVISELLTILQGTDPTERSNAVQSLRFVVVGLKEESAVSAVREIMPFLLKILLFEWRLSVEQFLAESTEMAAVGADVNHRGPYLLALGRFCVLCFKLFIPMVTSQMCSLSEPRPVASPDTLAVPSPSKAGKRPSKGKLFVANQKAIWQWIQQMVVYFPQIDALRRRIPFLRPFFEKFMAHGMRTTLLVLAREPLGLRHHLVLALSTATQFLKSDDRFAEGTLDFPKFAVRCLTFLHDVIECPEYRDDETASPLDDLRHTEAVTQLNAFFSPSTIYLICRMLLRSYMLLTSEELLTWQNAPEELVLMELNSFEESIRSSAETLFTALTRKWPDVCVPAILEALQECDVLSNPSSSPPSLPAILVKESVYNGVALAGYELQGHVDFAQLFCRNFAADLEAPDPRCRVIRRRIACIIENWFCLGSLPIPVDMIHVVFNTLLFLLRREEDTLTRIWAAIALRNVILRDDLDKSIFLPFLPSLFSSLIDLVSQLTHNFIHIQLLEIVSVIVKVIGAEVSHVISPLFAMLSVLWNSSERDLDLLRCNILRCMRCIVKASGRSFQQIDCVLPAIDFSISAAEGERKAAGEEGGDGDETDCDECHSDLIEDGLRLWETLLSSYFPDIPESLFVLFPKLKVILEASLYEHTEAIIKILFLYVFGGRGGFLNAFAADVISVVLCAIREVTGAVSVEAMPILHAVVLFLMENDPSLVDRVLLPLLERLLYEEDVFLQIHIVLVFGRVLVMAEHVFWGFFQQNRESLSSFLSLFVQIPSDSLTTADARLLLLAAKRLRLQCESDMNYCGILSSLDPVCESWMAVGCGDVSLSFEGMKENLSRYSSNLSCLLGKVDPVCVDW